MENDVNIVNRCFDLVWGFAWIEIEIDGEVMTLQLCLEERQRKGERHIKQYVNSIGKSGFDWGLCWDANEAPIEKLGINNAWALLKKELKEVGVMPVKEK
jgi:hypothetical protein